MGDRGQEADRKMNVNEMGQIFETRSQIQHLSSFTVRKWLHDRRDNRERESHNDPPYFF